MGRKSKNKLPSGSYRVQAYDYTDSGGRKHYKSFTAPTKPEAELLAAQWKTHRVYEQKAGMRILDAVRGYIEVKRSVLSPATVRGYEAILRNQIPDIGEYRVNDVTTSQVQKWVNDMAAAGYTPKYVRNAYGLFSATMDMYAPERRIKVTLPAKKRPELYCPSDEDIKKLLKEIRGTELEIAVLLAAFGTLRRGEICALTSDDIHGNIISVNKAIVKGDDNEYHLKQPKTYSSYREVVMPDFVIDRIRGIDGRIVKAAPDSITEQFSKAVKKAGLPHFRFHDLRHYSASIMHVMGVPDQYILQRGGWASDNVMKSVYRNAIDSETEKQSKKINDYFARLNREIS